MMPIGDELQSLETPALWVDLDIMEQNIALMAEWMKSAGVNWRPHTKGIKIPAIAHKLIDAGAMGVTCAKIAEAEIMAAGGIKDILIGNQVVGEKKIARLVEVQKLSDVMVAVEDFDNARQISEAAQKVGKRIRVLVEVNIGMNRAGVAPRETALAFVKQVLQLEGLEFKGLMGWEGHIVGIADPVEKDAAGHKAMTDLLDTVEMVRSAGIPVEIVSCGGSGSYKISAYTLGVTEIEAGGAILGDLTYVAWGAETRPSLFVLTTVTSRNVPDRAIVDGGQKTFTPVRMPKPLNLEGVEMAHLSSEHGVLSITNKDLPLKVGDKISFIVGYSDWTVFLHDRLYGIRKGKVKSVWEIPHKVV
jgi:D-serine deaminase-like pyridoxal phosphate-dependent protein